jgi:PhnB protein
MNEIVPFLNFDGNCRAAMEFYKQCFGAELYLLPFSEVPGNVLSEAQKTVDRIMHSSLSKGSTFLMAADILPGMPFQPGNNFAISIHPGSLEETERLFRVLADKGEVTMGLQDTFWNARFGMLTDQFGVRWMFNFALPKES